jgi:hypothetical protein
MRNENTLDRNKFILDTTFAIHNLIKDDECFNGYEATKEQFDDLYNQVVWLVNNVINPEWMEQENVIANWYDMQEGVMNGEVEVDWQNY